MRHDKLSVLSENFLLAKQTDSTSLATDPSHSFQDGLHAVFLQTMDNLNLVTRTYQTNPKGHSTKPKPLAVLFEAVSNMKDIERQGDILG